MQRIFQKKALLILPLLLLFLYAIPAGHADAKSAQWNSGNISDSLQGVLYSEFYCWRDCSNNDPDRRGYTTKYVIVGSIGNPSASITHSVTILDKTTSTNVSDGSIVPVGDTIQITPQADQSTDISWFATGYGTDSPYGSWIGENGSSLYTNPTGAEGINGWLDYDVVLDEESFENYANMAVQPTTPTISTTGSTAGLSCTGGTCVVNSAGTIVVTVSYPATTGKFYYSYYKTGQIPPSDEDYSGPDGPNELTIPMASGAKLYAANCSFEQSSPDLDSCLSAPANTFTVAVPAIPITFNFSATVATPPTPPAINGPTSGDDCSASSYTYTFTGSDPSGKTIRYGVDWDDDGTVDEWIPATGYVNSGTLQSTSHSWNTPGTYKFQALTQNVDGSTSGWTTYTVTISPCSLPNLVPESFTPTVVIAGQPYTFTGTIKNTGTLDTPQAVPADIYVCLQSDSNCVSNLALSFWQELFADALGGIARAAAAIDIQLTPLTIPQGQTTNPASVSQATFAVAGNYEAELCADTPVSAPPITVAAGDTLCTPKQLLVVCPAGDTIVNGACAATPTCIFSVNPTSVNVGQTSTLTWSSINATSCSGGLGFSTGGATSGSVQSSPLSSTTSYNLMCTGSGGQTCNQPLTVTVNAPTATLTANPTLVASGGTTALTWSSTKAASCTMTRNQNNWTTPGTANATSGTNVTDATPITAQTTYTLSCGGATAQAIVNIVPAYQNF